ncbi:small subunit ribosomal protein S16 [Microdochium nivale]|nr:small subunit ribosomal protein S16 [Microdochium nivale]
MVIKIRLARFGRRNLPTYNIVVTHARTARSSRPLEVIGTYDPLPKPDPYETSGRLHKDIKLDQSRAKYWIGVGAQPTDPVWRLLNLVRKLMTHTLAILHSPVAPGEDKFANKLRTGRHHATQIPRSQEIRTSAIAKRGPRTPELGTLSW